MEEIKEKKAVWSNVGYALSLYWEERKAILILCGFAVILRVALPYLGILMPKVVLDQILAGAEPAGFFLAAGTMAVLLVIVNYLKGFTDSIVNDSIGTTGIGIILLKSNEKRITMDYELMTDPEFKKLNDKAEKAIQSNHSLAMNIPKTLVELFSNSFGFILYAGTIALIHPLILVILLFTATVNSLMLSRARSYMERTREERSKHYTKLSAINNALRKPEAAKDIRLYNAFSWLYGIFNKQYAIHKKAERKLLSKNMHAGLVDALMIVIRDGMAYLFLFYLVLNGRMSLGDFVFIFAAIGALAGWVTGIIDAYSNLAKANIEMGDCINVLSYPDKMNVGRGIPLPKENELPPVIELKNLSYTYPEAEKPALKDINLSIKAGERIAVVGANGAGKSTLVKLIAGLYSPSSGEVLLGGHPVSAYNRDEYYSLFSAVFQEIHLLSASIKENISQKPLTMMDQSDNEKVLQCLKDSGLITKTDTLPDKDNTLLVRAVNPNAAELSGGEQQKLALARALYKDAPVLLLDEPTAALDPLAENKIYQEYAELTRGKTSVFISHRLASTRFCDRILLIKDSIIAEEGTHDELMSLGGTYAEMFTIQASYYSDEEVNIND